MAQKYRKIDPRIWRDEKFVKLSPEAKLVAIYCLTAQVNRCGIFVFSPAMAAEELETLPQTFRERFRNVCQTLNWGWDEASRVLYFPTWWKYNQPENGNVLKGNLTDIDDLPETPLLERFYTNFRYLPETLHQTFRERYPKRYPKPSPNQEQEQEQEQEIRPPIPPVPGECDQPDIDSTPGAVAKPRRTRRRTTDNPNFDRFWKDYPKKVAKPAAQVAFAKINPSEECLSRILAALAVLRRSEDWLREGGRFIPHPASWLNGRRWEDEGVVAVPPAGGSPWPSAEELEAKRMEWKAVSDVRFPELTYGVRGNGPAE